MSTSEQARADAMADAWTLEQFARGPATWKRTEQEYAVAEAVFRGEGARYSMRYRGECDVSVPTLAGEQAYKAARAAFRAVPGLRGE